MTTNNPNDEESLPLTKSLLLLKSYHEHHAKGQEEQKACFWNLLKARRHKAMGSVHAGNEISARHIREELRAQQRLVITSEEKNKKESVVSLQLIQATKQQQYEQNDIDQDKENALADSTNPPATGLRNRRQPKAVDEKKEMMIKEEQTSPSPCSEEELLVQSDPLDLFGGMPHKSLRTAQQEAQSTLESYVQAANVAAAIIQLTSTTTNA